MQPAQLLKRNLVYYWRVNLAVVFGVATAVAVLAGALLVGDSVRGSLRDLFLQKLGNTDHVVTSPGFFREQLAADIQNNGQFAAGGFAATTPLIALKGTITHEASGRLASDVRVYGVDERFWTFHGREHQALQNRESLINDSLLRELGAHAGDVVLLRVQKPSDIPAESLHSKKEDLGRTLRLTLRAALSLKALGEFSIQPEQSATRAIFVPLKLLQRELEQEGKANLILIAEASRGQANSAKATGSKDLLGKILDESTELADLGIKLRPLNEQQNISLEHDSKLINDKLAETATKVADRLSMHATPILSYLANSISSDERSIPYSLVTALDEESLARLQRSDGETRRHGDTETRGRGDSGKRRYGAAPTLGRNDNKSVSGDETETGERGEHLRPSPALRVPVSPVPVSSHPNVPESPRPRVAVSPHRRVAVSPSLRVAVSPRPRVAVSGSSPPIVLNEWAAHELGVRVGDPISIEYYLWHEDGRLETKNAQFELAGIVPITGFATDRDLVPEYPGITGSVHLADWDPPFPVDLGRVRKQDEDYWKEYRTTPKAFIPLSVGQRLWQTRFGSLTSMRITPPDGMPLQQAVDSYRQQLKSTLNPGDLGLTVMPARQQGLAASRGATNFGEYFLYFSFFLVVSALLLTALFFKLGVEQRLQEIGLLQAVGFPATRVRKLFLFEGVVLSVIGSLLGLAGALAYGQLMMLGLRTWWVDAVGTTGLTLHLSPLSLLLGAAGGVLAALLCIVWTLRQLGRQSTRSLLMGTLADVETRRRGEGGTRRHGDSEKRRHGEAETGRDGDRETRGQGDGVTTSPGRPVAVSPLLRVSVSPRRRVSASPRLLIAFALTLIGLGLLLLASFQVIGQTAGFFGSGIVLLASFLCYQSAWLRRNQRTSINGKGMWPVFRLGFRNATYRPGRSVLCIALIASAAFIIVSVDAFRRRSGTLPRDRKSGSGGFALLAESLLPVVHDPNTPQGQEALNLTTEGSSSPLSGVSFARFRVRPGDDASCLNLYQPHNPRIIAPTEEFIRSNRFAFQETLAGSKEEKENPWLLLHHEFADGAIPVIADANSMTYVLHLKLGDEFILNRDNGPVRLRMVGSLADSVFQSELLMSEQHFLRLFPEQEGYRFFLIDTATPDQVALIAALEDRLSDFGFDVVPTEERLAEFHRVENTYLSTFQMLGGLGLLLGTLGMAAVLLRNVLERRRELALLRAIGYRSSHFTLMVTAENALLLLCGLLTGIVCALLAIAPVFLERGGRLPNISLGLLLLAVLVSGLTASLIATWAALRSPLLPALRAE